MNMTLECAQCRQQVEVQDQDRRFRTMEGAKIRQGKYQENGYNLYRLYFNNVLVHKCMSVVDEG